MELTARVSFRPSVLAVRLTKSPIVDEEELKYQSSHMPIKVIASYVFHLILPRAEAFIPHIQ
jgi:hypothetical protein